MKTFKAVLTALIVLSFSAMGQGTKSHKYQIDSTKAEKPVLQKQHKNMGKSAQHLQQYTCPMHPEVISDTPGKCPKCKMALVKKESRKIKELKSVIYTCPMHPEVVSDKPGKCPKCKMALEKE
jgi:hypothetical protein